MPKTFRRWNNHTDALAEIKKLHCAKGLIVRTKEDRMLAIKAALALPDRTIVTRALPEGGFIIGAVKP